MSDVVLHMLEVLLGLVDPGMSWERAHRALMRHLTAPVLPEVAQAAEPDPRITPLGLAGEWTENGIRLRWTAERPSEVRAWRLYRLPREASPVTDSLRVWQGHSLEAVDGQASIEHHHWYVVQGLDRRGRNGAMSRPFLVEPPAEEVDNPERPPLRLRGPNPFRAHVRWQVEAEALGSAWRARLYDVRGRLVRRWEPGAESVVGLEWDGTDTHGRPVAAGAYVLRVEAGPHRWHSVVMRSP